MTDPLAISAEPLYTIIYIYKEFKFRKCSLVEDKRLRITAL